MITLEEAVEIVNDRVDYHLPLRGARQYYTDGEDRVYVLVDDMLYAYCCSECGWYRLEEKRNMATYFILLTPTNPLEVL